MDAIFIMAGLALSPFDRLFMPMFFQTIKIIFVGLFLWLAVAAAAA